MKNLPKKASENTIKGPDQGIITGSGIMVRSSKFNTDLMEAVVAHGSPSSAIFAFLERF